METWKYYKTTGGNGYSKKRVYEISDLGRVRVNGEIKEPKPHYRYLQICDFFVHRAVAELFIPNPDNKPFVDHINTDRYDNRACNLQWVTQKENCNNTLTKKHIGESSKGRMTGRHWKNVNGKRVYYDNCA